MGGGGGRGEGEGMDVVRWTEVATLIKRTGPRPCQWVEAKPFQASSTSLLVARLPLGSPS